MNLGLLKKTWFIIAVLLISLNIKAQQDYSLELNGVSQYGCSTWVMEGITFEKTIDSLRAVYPSAQLVTRLYEIKEGQILLKEEFSGIDLKYVQDLLNIIVKDLTDILFIEKKISVKVIAGNVEDSKDGNLSPKVSCSKNSTRVDIALVSKLFLESLNRAVKTVNSFEDVNSPYSEELDPKYFFNIWSEEYTSRLSNEDPKLLKMEALRMNRIAYFTFSEFYRFFLFTLAHEMYPVITKCETSLEHEKKADLMGAVVFQFLYRHLNYDKGQIWACIFGSKDNYHEVSEQKLLDFLFGRDVNHIYEFLYKGTSLSHGGENYLPLAERESFISKSINEVHINQLYKNYEKIIKRFNRK